MYPDNSFLVYGDSGVGKSTFAATFPTPMLVMLFDPKAKGLPYKLKKGKIKSGKTVTAPGYEDAGGVIYYDDVLNTEDNKLVCRVEEYLTADIQGGVNYVYAYENFMARMPSLVEEVRKGKWKTVVVDSVSSLLYEARKLDEYKMNPSIAEGRKPHGKQLYGAAASAIEEIVRSRLAVLSCNVVLLAHIKAERDGVRDTMYFYPEAPGAQARLLPGVFAEVYVMLSDDDSNSYLQTRKSKDYIATSLIQAPNPCEPYYNKLWENWN